MNYDNSRIFTVKYGSSWVDNISILELKKENETQSQHITRLKKIQFDVEKFRRNNNYDIDSALKNDLMLLKTNSFKKTLSIYA